MDTTGLASSGTILLEAVGCAPAPCDLTDPGRLRTVEVELRQRSFLDYLYFTNYETQPPLVYPQEDRDWVMDNCARRRWEQPRPTSGRPSNSGAGCIEITWASHDRTNGPWHTNDRFRTNGSAQWLASATSSDPSDPPFDQTGIAPSFAEGIGYADPLPLPPSNGQLLADADYRLNAEGCLFTGPTEITLNDTGTVTVRSPNTRQSGPGCGSWTNGVDPPQTISIPANGVIYVQPIPGNAGDDNYHATCRGTGGAGRINGLGYPYGDDPTTYNCRAGDVFIEGTLDGRLTVGAYNNITITWHLLYDDLGEDMLGLVSNDLIAVYHPLTRPSSGAVWRNANAGPRHPGAPFEDPRIHAAMLSVRNSFYVQSFDRGRLSNNSCDPLGDLYVYGAIAQLFRGPVAQGSPGQGACTGYNKDYNYDPRLAFSNPPRFINPVDAQWVVSRFAEQF